MIGINDLKVVFCYTNIRGYADFWGEMIVLLNSCIREIYTSDGINRSTMCVFFLAPFREQGKIGSISNLNLNQSGMIVC